MNNKIVFCVLFLAGLVIPSLTIAQSNLSFGFSGVNHEDTLNIGDDVNFSFWLINQGEDSINDSIVISCETFDILGMSISSMSIGESYNTLGSLNVGDSIYITITESITYSSYVLGDNIIVIWPAILATGSVDTSVTPIHILDSISAGHELAILSSQLQIFPNPASNKLNINSEVVKQRCHIQITDVFGNIVFVRRQVELSDFIMNVNWLSQGIYFVVFIFNDTTITKKIIIN